MTNRKNTATWAKYKNGKRLKRKNRTHVPKLNFVVSREDLVAPEVFSLIDSREQTIEYFEKVLRYSKQGKFITMDMSRIIRTDALTVSLVIAIMMDNRASNVNSFVKHVTVKVPVGDSQPAKIFRNSHFDDTVRTRKSDQNYFMSRTDKVINKSYTKEIIDFAEKKGVLDAKTILNPVLVEIFSNTNNHASILDGEIPWFLSIMDYEGKLCFSVIDLGMGIFESLRTNQALRNLPPIEFDVVEDMYENQQSKYLSSQIPKGVYSSTNEACRGKGLKEIYDKANYSTTCQKFVIISNKAMVDLLNIQKVRNDSGVSFNGTAFYWEMIEKC